MRALACAPLLVLTGCAALTGARPVIEQRFVANPGDPKAEKTPTVGISVSSSDVEKPPSGVSLTALGDRAQAALIAETKGKPPILIKGPNAPKPVVVVRDTIARHLVVAVQPLEFLQAGDRVDAIRISLEVSPSTPRRWWISSWTRATNGTKVVELGKLTDTNSSKIAFETGVKAVGFLPDAKVSGENSQTSAREVQLKDVTEFDAAVDQDGRAWLTEVAGWRESSAHNLAVDVVLATDPANLKPSGTVSYGDLEVEASGGKSPAEPSAVVFREGTVLTPVMFERDPVCGTAKLNYRIRHVVSGNETFSESDDVVEYRTGTFSSGFLMSPAPMPRYYVLTDATGRPMSYEMDGASSPATLIFETLEEAATFRSWLRMRAPATGRLANARVGFSVAKKLRAATADEYGTLTPAAYNESPLLPTSAACRLPAEAPAEGGAD